jgi:hypothetical protein
MGVISTTTFDPLRKYVNVRLQQGVPLVDADWNELDDIRKFEVRAFLKWFVGDGIPGNSDSFLIEGTGDNNSFLIHSGVDKTTVPAGISNQERGLRYAGNCLVDGMDVIITDDIKFTDQLLHPNKNPNAKLLASSSGGGAIKAITTTAADSTIVAYLDVWEWLVTIADDPTLVLQGIGTESCARIKREWVVRVDNKLPAPTDPAPLYVPGHSYYGLAKITRRANDPVIKATDIANIRQTRLTLSDLLQRVSRLERLTLLPAFDPSPNQFSPKTGVVGQDITLHGRNFTVGTPQVQFGTVNATIDGVPTPNQLTVKVPAGLTGSTPITVTNDGGSATTVDTFRVLPVPTFAPSPNQFNPKAGTIGQQFTITGTNLDTVRTIALVAPTATGGATRAAANILSAAPTQLVALIAAVTTPGDPNTYGPTKVVLTSDVGSATSDDSFTLNAPAPSFAPSPNQFTPKSGIGGQAITLSGNNFDAPQRQVLFGAFPSTIASSSANQIVAIVPVGIVPPPPVGGPPVPVKITITTLGGTVVSNDTFNVISA